MTPFISSQGPSDLCGENTTLAVLRDVFGYHGDLYAVYAAIQGRAWDGQYRYQTIDETSCQQIAAAVEHLDTRLYTRLMPSYPAVQSELDSGHPVVTLVAMGVLDSSQQYPHYVYAYKREAGRVYTVNGYIPQADGAIGAGEQDWPEALFEQAVQSGPPGPDGVAIWWLNGSQPPSSRRSTLADVLHAVGVAVETINSTIGPALKPLAGTETALHDLGVVSESLSAQGPVLQAAITELGG